MEYGAGGVDRDKLFGDGDGMKGQQSGRVKSQGSGPDDGPACRASDARGWTRDCAIFCLLKRDTPDNDRGYRRLSMILVRYVSYRDGIQDYSRTTVGLLAQHMYFVCKMLRDHIYHTT